MAKKMKNTCDLTCNMDTTMSPMLQQKQLLSGQVSNVGLMAMAMAMEAKGSVTSALDATIQHEIRMGTLDPNMDMKSMRRIISNRYAAKKSHIKKVNKLTQLENNRRELENTIATLQHQIEHEWQIQLRLRIENDMLAQQLQIYTNLKNMKEGQIAENTMERRRLRGLLSMQVQEQPNNGGIRGVKVKRERLKKSKLDYNFGTEGSNSSNTILIQSMYTGQSSNSKVGSMAVGARSSSTAALDAAIEYEIRMGTIDPNMDKKSMRRIISNRYAAKKSHEKKVNKLIELENNRKHLEKTIAALHPLIEYESQLLSRLRIENENLTHQLQIHMDLQNKKEAQIAEKTMERQFLTGIMNMQVQQQPDIINGGTDPVFDPLDFDPNHFPY
ncbi:hypothetical protein LXL04_036590 [Taraxacum kok-saghyz]